MADPKSTLVRLLITLLILAGIGPGVGGATPSSDETDRDLRRLGLEPVPEKKDPDTGFLVAGKNPTPLIAHLGSINGRRIAELEQAMRPGKASTAGFLGVGEGLLDVLAKDNRYVVEELGLTHQELARHLRIVAAVPMHENKLEAAFAYRGRKFEVKLTPYRGFQDSPFGDGTKTNYDASLLNLENGKRLRYSLLVPEMIERYGFYEGEGTPYRVPPRDIVEVLDFLLPKAERP